MKMNENMNALSGIVNSMGLGFCCEFCVWVESPGNCRRARGSPPVHWEGRKPGSIRNGPDLFQMIRWTPMGLACHQTGDGAISTLIDWFTRQKYTHARDWAVYHG